MKNPDIIEKKSQYSQVGLKNPYKSSDLKRYIWVIARLGGWKGYVKQRKPGITTFWIGLQKFSAIMQG
ncbi:MAG: hypothetical protein AAGC43_17955, partial [Bacteroidota bacterium]